MKYEKGTYGDMDHYNGEFYKIRMTESKAYLVPLGPDDVETDWEVGQSHVLGVNALTTEQFNKAYSIKIKGQGHPVKTFFTDNDLNKQYTKPGKYYLYEWESDTNYQLNIDVLGLNLTYKVGEADMEALTNL